MKIRFAVLISILSVTLMSGCGFNTTVEDKEQEAFDKRMDELDKSIKENQASIDELGKSIEEKAEYIDSIGSENEKLNPEEDKDECSVFDFSYQDFIKNLTTNLESVGISTGETKYLDSVTFITIILPDNSSGTIKVLSNDSQNVSCIIVPIELVSDDILAAITEIIDNTISVTKEDIDSGPYTVNGVLYLSNDRTLSILPDE